MLLSCIKKINPDDVILTGGDPLLVDPSFYEDILHINNTVTLSFTTNLWDFYINPLKWIKLFKNSRVNVGTSFQYGNLRKKPDGSVFSEYDFLKIIDLFHKYVGYVPSFISVISDENAKFAIDHLHLAKKIGAKCKLNCMLPLGKSHTFFLKDKLFQIYVDAIEHNMQQYESYLSKCSSHSYAFQYCPNNMLNMCALTNRALLVKNDVAYYSYCEDLLYLDMCKTTDVNDLTLTHYESHKHIPNKCYMCECFNICHNCLLYSSLLDKISITTNYCNYLNSVVKKLKQFKFL